jgi:hypothetical protein
MIDGTNAAPQEDGWRASPAVERAENDFLIQNWLRIAACAWEGFLRMGPGFVFCREEEPGRFSFEYRLPTFWPCFPAPDRNTYDPREEVVVLFDEPWVVGGWPTPPGAYAMLTAEMVGAPVQ